MFELPYPVPFDLILPFGQFVEKYELQNLMPLIFGFAQGLLNLLAQPTLYVFKNFGFDFINDLTSGFLTTELYNSLLYEHAQDSLGDIFLNSKILVVDRSCEGGSQVLIQTPSGQTLVKSSEIGFTTPPKLDNPQG